MTRAGENSTDGLPFAAGPKPQSLTLGFAPTMNAAPRDFGRVQVSALAFCGPSLARGQNRLASAPALGQFSVNTRAVPLARKRDAHKGRVFFSPRCKGQGEASPA